MTSRAKSKGAERPHTVAQVADICQVSERTVHRWIAAGHLPVTRLGRLIRVNPRDLDAFLREGFDDV
jgi:excisionase family DNA binding protein